LISDGIIEKRCICGVAFVKKILVLVEAILIRIWNIGDKVGIRNEGVTVKVKATSTILLSRLTTVLPVTIKITAELRLARTVITGGGIKTRVKAMDGGVTVVVSDTLIKGFIVFQASRSRCRGVDRVGIVGKESTLENGTINTFVLAARDISLVVASVATISNFSLATVQRRTVTITETRLARKDATTTSSRGCGTVAVDGLIVNDENIGKVNILGAINKADTNGNKITASLLTTVRPIAISIGTQSTTL